MYKYEFFSNNFLIFLCVQEEVAIFQRQQAKWPPAFLPEPRGEMQVPGQGESLCASPGSAVRTLRNSHHRHYLW